jgi:hypothetical protein
MQNNNQGYEWAYVAKSLCRKSILLVFQYKFSVGPDIVQQIVEVNPRSLNQLYKLGWNRENTVSVMMKNRNSRSYANLSANDNIILLCKNELRSFLGRTWWDLLQSSECFLVNGFST